MLLRDMLHTKNGETRKPQNRLHGLEGLLLPRVLSPKLEGVLRNLKGLLVHHIPLHRVTCDPSSRVEILFLIPRICESTEISLKMFRKK